MATNHEREPFGIKDTLMNSLPSNSSANDGSAEINETYAEVLDQIEAAPVPLANSGTLDGMNTTYAEMLDDIEAEIALLQGSVKRRRRALRRQARRQAMDRVALYRRSALVMLGVSFFVVGVVMLLTGQPHALDMFDRAMTAWATAFAVPPKS
ncbi:hypothetical protein ACWCY1_10380 [Streptomyces goshikiensis]|uniref:hypothetical protein n=1 Tax=Streptomyces TaxID=1883 RepID=UPI0009390121|nr:MULTISPECIES: hypothetical protein [Streptomyces]OKI38059.1 hypothetical protein A6A28_31120 [Streptomyces sp. CB03578]GHD82112.1 hypothetical protein GCM10010336_68960 [Streptomyces goshikiensis]